MKSKTSSWIIASRPKTLPASIGPVILGASIAPITLFKENLLIFFITITCALLLQIATNMVNDYYDSLKGLDDKNRLGPDRALQKGYLDKSELRFGFIIVFIIAFLLGILLMIKGGLPIVVIGLLSMAAAYFYTGGPFPLSYFALGELMALIFFGPIPVWGTYYLLTGDYNLMPATYGLIPGFISLSLMGVNNLRDHVNDKEKGKRTLTTLFGEKFGRSLVFVGVVISILIPLFLYLETDSLFFLTPLLLFMAFYKVWKYVLLGSIDQKLNNILAYIGKFLFLNCLLVAIGFWNLS